MKFTALALMSCMMLAGCSDSGARAKACQIFSPAPVSGPTTQNDQRVEAQATGEPADDRNQEQNCP
jgi:ABC-type uncharacterized transport system auxiliary subunit